MMRRKIGMGLGKMVMGLSVFGWAISGFSTAQALEISGFVDTSYTYNLDAAPTGLNTLRGFDTEANNFNLQTVEVVMQQPADKGPGYKVVLNYGPDANLMASAGTGTADEIDVQQAFITIPVLGGELMFGKFATLHGAEVIESPANLNFTRSQLFFYAIPFTHTGVRLHYAFNDIASGHIGINNGWDNVKDLNSDKSLELQVGVTPMEMFSVSVAGMFGSETPFNTDGSGSDIDGDGTLDVIDPPGAEDNSENRSLIDVVATIKPVDKVTIVLNYDNGTQDKFDGTNDAKWSGFAGYLNYAFSDMWAATLRVESLNDEDGYRTNFAGGQTLSEQTLTAAYTPAKNLMVRAEYRHDSSDEDSFVDGDGLATDKQDTVGLEFIYSF